MNGSSNETHRISNDHDDGGRIDANNNNNNGDNEEDEFQSHDGSVVHIRANGSDAADPYAMMMATTTTAAAAFSSSSSSLREQQQQHPQPPEQQHRPQFPPDRTMSTRSGMTEVLATQHMPTSLDRHRRAQRVPSIRRPISNYNRTDDGKATGQNGLTGTSSHSRHSTSSSSNRNNNNNTSSSMHGSSSHHHRRLDGGGGDDDDEMSESERPGAYSVQNRANGILPAWHSRFGGGRNSGSSGDGGGGGGTGTGRYLTSIFRRSFEQQEQPQQPQQSQQSQSHPHSQYNGNSDVSQHTNLSNIPSEHRVNFDLVEASFHRSRHNSEGHENGDDGDVDPSFSADDADGFGSSSVGGGNNNRRGPSPSETRPSADNDNDDDNELDKSKNTSPCLSFSSRRTIIMVIASVSIVLIAIVVGVSIAVTSNSNNDNNNNNDTAQDSMSSSSSSSSSPSSSSSTNVEDEDRTSQLRQVLSTITSPDSFEDLSSPQFMALLWLADEDPMQVPVTDPALELFNRFVLSCLYYATTGPDWLDQLNFLTGRPVCEWHNDTLPTMSWQGVMCNDDNQITGIYIDNNAMEGFIPDEIAALSHLQTLSLTGNTYMVGNNRLPLLANVRSIGRISNLRSLNISNNLLYGSVPSSLFSLSNLEELDLYNNDFEGNVDTKLGTLSSLRHLNVGGNNNLKGFLRFETLTNLETLVLDDLNDGAEVDVQSQILPLTKLSELSLRSVDTSEPFLSDLSTLSALKVLYLDDTDLEGTIGTSFSALTSLQRLSVKRNFLSGSILSENFSTLTKLEFLDLSDNSFVGNIPSLPSSLMELRVEENDFSGSMDPVCQSSPILEISLDCQGNSNIELEINSCTCCNCTLR